MSTHTKVTFSPLIFEKFWSVMTSEFLENHEMFYIYWLTNGNIDVIMTRTRTKRDNKTYPWVGSPAITPKKRKMAFHPRSFSRLSFENSESSWLFILILSTKMKHIVYVFIHIQVKISVYWSEFIFCV